MQQVAARNAPEECGASTRYQVHPFRRKYKPGPLLIVRQAIVTDISIRRIGESLIGAGVICANNAVASEGLHFLGTFSRGQNLTSATRRCCCLVVSWCVQTLSKLDLNLLRSLDALFATANVSKAAAQLKVGQSTLSAQLARLRIIFNDDLLVPSESGRGLALTPRSMQLQAQIRDLMSRIESVVIGSEAAKCEGQSSILQFNIAVAASDSASLSLVAKSIPHLKATLSSSVRASVRQVQRNEFVGQLEQGNADVLVARQPVVPAPLKSKMLATESFVFVQRKGHPRGEQPPSIAEFCELPHVASLAPSRQSSPVDEAMSFLNLQRNIAFESDSPLVTLEILAHTDCIAAVPSRIVDTGEFDVFPLPFPVPPLAICMSWHTRTHHDPLSRTFREQLFDAVQRHASQREHLSSIRQTTLRPGQTVRNS